MKLLGPLFRLIDLTREERGAGQIALGVVLGLWLGLNDATTLHWWAALVAAFVLRTNPALTALFALLFSALAPLLDSGFDALGTTALLHTPSLNRLWSGLYHAPVFAYTRFNNTVVMGALLVSTVLSPVLYAAARVLVARKGRALLDWLIASPIGNAWNASLLNIVYIRARAGGPATAPRRALRPWGLAPFAAAAVVGAAYTALFLDAHLEALVARYGALVNGAEVSIGSLSTSLWRGEAELTNIQVAHHVQPMRNRLEIERVHAKFDSAALLRRKLIVDEIVVEGIHYDSRRARAAEIPTEVRRGATGPGLVDRKPSSGFFTGVRDELRDNPLRSLPRLVTGMDLDAKIGTLRGELKAPGRLADHSRELAALATKWEARTRELTTFEEMEKLAARISRTRSPASQSPDERRARETLTEARGKLEEAVRVMRAESDAFAKKLTAVDGAIEEDVATVRRKLGLPRMDFDDLSRQVLGPKLLGYLERVSYWVDLSRRRMPKGSRQDQITVVPQERSQGVNVHFGKMSTYPAVLVRRVTFRSEPRANEARGHVRGTIEGITSDPPILGEPLKVSIEAAFPAAGIERAKIEAVIDHTGETARESLKIAVASFPLERWMLNETPDLAVSLAKSKASLGFDASFTDQEVSARWKLSADAVDYAILSPYKQLEASLYAILSPLYRFDVDATVIGPLDKPRLDVTSELGRRLASGLRSEYKHTFLAIDDNLRRDIQDGVELARRDIVERFRDTRARYLEPLETRLKYLQLKLASADEIVKRFPHR